MANHLVQARVSDALKTQADMIFTSIGLTTSDAIRMFLQQSVNLGGLPFQPMAKIPNKETIAAMEELQTNKNLKSYSAEEFHKWLDAQ